MSRHHVDRAPARRTIPRRGGPGISLLIAYVRRVPPEEPSEAMRGYLEIKSGRPAQVRISKKERAARAAKLARRDAKLAEFVVAPKKVDAPRRTD